MFFGVPSVVRRTDRFALSHWIARPETTVPEHAHLHAHFVFISAGEFESGADGRPSQVIFNPRGTVHRDHFSSRSGSFLTITSHATLSDWPSMPRAPVYVRDPRAIGLAVRLMRECSVWDWDAHSIAEDLCTELAACITADADASKHRPPWLDRAIELLDGCAGAPMSMQDISRAIGVHAVHLTRTFRRFLRCTPGEYARARRTRSAAELLRSRSMPLGDVAIAAGFADQSHLTTVFRRMYGITPGEYRQEVCFAKDRR